MDKVVTHVCEQCGWRFDILECDNGMQLVVEFTYEEDPEPGPTPCPLCLHTDHVRVFTAPLPVALGDIAGVGKHYPYFDRGLGMQINNHAQRQRVIKERNLIPLEGDTSVDIGAIEDRRLADIDKACQRWRDTDTMYQEHSDYKEAYHRIMEGRYAKPDKSRRKGGYKPEPLYHTELTDK